MNLKGTKTEKNLQEAFAGESMARNKYTYFASKAKKEGYVQIAAIFEETAGNEKEHAKMWYKYLNGGAVGSTVENLTAAAEGENVPVHGRAVHKLRTVRGRVPDEARRARDMPRDGVGGRGGGGEAPRHVVHRVRSVQLRVPGVPSDNPELPARQGRDTRARRGGEG